MANKFLNDTGLSRVWAKNKELLGGKADSVHTHVQSDVTGLTDALNSRYTKSETYSQSEVDSKLNNLNYLNILNKGVVNATLATYSTVCTEYVQTNYGRAPKKWDTIIVTLTDQNDDKVKYTYSDYSKAWIDTGREGMTVSQADNTTAGIMKLYSSASAENTDGAVTQAGVKTAIDGVQASVDTLSDSVYKKTETYSKTEVFSKTETYGRSELYTKTEVDGQIPVAMTNTEIDVIINA